MSLPDPWLEAEYNNRLKVPEHPAIMAGWQARAAALRETHPHADYALRYGPSERQAIDIFWPAADRTAPLAMFIHGGYWQGLDRSWFSHLARGFLDHGVALALPSYDLCPNVSLATIVEQLRAAAAFLIDRDRRDLYVTGHSAGGHLAAMLLATDWAARGQSAGRIRGGCAISGLFDLEPLVQTSINGALLLDRAEALRLSPLGLPSPRLPFRAVVGGREGHEYLRQSRSIAEAWGGQLDVAPDADHFTVIAPLEDAGSPLMARIMADFGRR